MVKRQVPNLIQNFEVKAQRYLKSKILNYETYSRNLKIRNNKNMYAVLLL